LPTIRTLYKQGNSVVLSVPSFIVEWLQCDVGDHVVLDQQPDRTVQLAKFSVERKTDPRRGTSEVASVPSSDSTPRTQPGAD
jgi:antitoxin component of MazEF toxin-antitoxin module